MCPSAGARLSGVIDGGKSMDENCVLSHSDDKVGCVDQTARRKKMVE